MITLTIDPSVLAKLKLAMPKTDKAELALEKYRTVLQRFIEDSLLNMENNLFRHYKNFNISTHDFELQVGQFVINDKKQYLHSWLDANGLSLLQVTEVGLKGKSLSKAKLTKLVTMTDAMDINTLRKKSINELDALLNDKSLTDVEFFYRVFPDFLTLSAQQLKENYDFTPIDTSSLKQFIVWLTHRANKMNQVERQMLARQAQVILRIAEVGDGELPQKKKHSHFGRTYYQGISVQSVHRTLREAMMGNCYQYDIRISVVSWKMGFAELCFSQLQDANSFEQSFSACMLYLKDKKKFRNLVKTSTFGTDSDINDEVQMDIVKQALTALSFGARIYQHGWINQSGKEFNPAIVKIIKRPEDRKRFIDCDLIKKFRDEQKKLDSFIFELYTSQYPSILTDKELKTDKGKKSTAKIMAYLYQHTETLVMDVVRDELKKLGREVIASVHDAIFIRHRLSAYDRENIQYKMRDISGIDYWVLEQDKHEAYKGVSQEVLRDELAHKQLIAQQTQAIMV